MRVIFFFIILHLFLRLNCQDILDSVIPIRGLCIKSPAPQGVDRFVEFINNELSKLKLNTLILRVDYDYKYDSRPKLANDNALNKYEVKKILSACRNNGIKLIPQINLFGHQSWHSSLGSLLKVYPEFDETPDIKLPDEYKWPNSDTLYCKSYCPLHPKLHEVVFDIVDEIIDVFEADVFHAGLDEVFYIGHYNCVRCRGKDKAKLFADEVNKINKHLKSNNTELWMWGDRLINGKLTGIGMWEASENDTYQAIDMIEKDVVINDWHYETAYPTSTYFAMKGFDVISCSWRKTDVAINQVKQIIINRSNSNDSLKILKNRFKGVLHTVWSSNKSFLDAYYGIKDDKSDRESECFKSMFEYINGLKL